MMKNYRFKSALSLVALAMALPVAPAAMTESPVASPLNASRKSLKLPGMAIDIQKKRVDLQATVCLDHGSLALVDCTHTGSDRLPHTFLFARSQVKADLKQGNAGTQETVGDTEDERK